MLCSSLEVVFTFSFKHPKDLVFLLCPDMYTTLKPLQSGLSYLSLYLMHFDVMASNDAVDTVIT